MAILFQTLITDVGPEVASLAEGGVLILFAEGSPPELAEVSVLHAVKHLADDRAPVPGNTITLGNISAKITAIGELAWRKVHEMGHVVINFNGQTSNLRPGEICACAINTDQLITALIVGQTITIG